MSDPRHSLPPVEIQFSIARPKDANKRLLTTGIPLFVGMALSSLTFTIAQKSGLHTGIVFSVGIPLALILSWWFYRSLRQSWWHHVQFRFHSDGSITVDSDVDGTRHYHRSEILEQKFNSFGAGETYTEEVILLFTDGSQWTIQKAVGRKGRQALRRLKRVLKDR